MSIILNYQGRVIENLLNESDARRYELNGKSYFIKEGKVISPIILTGELIAQFVKMILERGTEIPENPLLFDAWHYESIEYGIRDLF